jgi:hypothetical protein
MERERERERERESEENERRKRDRESLMRSVTELWYHHCMSSRIRTVTVADWLELTCTHSSRVYARTHADVKDLTRAYEKSGRQDLISEVQLRACIGARPRESGALASAAYRQESDRRESDLTQSKPTFEAVCVCMRAREGRRVCVRGRRRVGKKILKVFARTIRSNEMH